mgnify:CR=1 FL=1
MDRNVICMKWGSKYDALYVNRLYSMVQRNLTLPHRFICFTEHPEGLAEGIEAKPLPALDLPDGLPERGWNKLTTLKDPLDDLQGDALFLDLDLLILDNIDCFFEAEGEFLIINDWLYPNRVTGNSSIYRFRVNEHADVLDYFIKNQDKVRAKFRNEQAYLSQAIHDKGMLHYWPEDWCVSFKRQCMQKGLMGLLKEPKFPEKAKAVIFHGKPDPDQAILGNSGKWFRPMKPCTWIEKYWH